MNKTKFDKEKGVPRPAPPRNAQSRERSRNSECLHTDEEATRAEKLQHARIVQGVFSSAPFIDGWDAHTKGVKALHAKFLATQNETPEEKSKDIASRYAEWARTLPSRGAVAEKMIPSVHTHYSNDDGAIQEPHMTAVDPAYSTWQKAVQQSQPRQTLETRAPEEEEQLTKPTSRASRLLQRQQNTSEPPDGAAKAGAGAGAGAGTETAASASDQLSSRLFACLRSGLDDAPVQGLDLLGPVDWLSRNADEAEEAEKKRKAEEAEKKRKAEEAEKKRKAEESLPRTVDPLALCACKSGRLFSECHAPGGAKYRPRNRSRGVGGSASAAQSTEAAPLVAPPLQVQEQQAPKPVCIDLTNASDSDGAE